MSVSVPNYLRFADLKSEGICASRATLSRWIKRHNFPTGKKIGPGNGARIWSRREVERWIASRAA